MTEPVSFQKVLDALLDDKREFPRGYLSEFSDIGSLELKTLMDVWSRVEPSRKQSLLKELQVLNESNTLVCFDDFARELLKDPEPAVRMRALHLLEECEDAKLVPIYINLLKNDNDASVRSASVDILGLFVDLGELEKIPEKIHHQVEDALLSTLKGEDEASVRRQALESLGYSSRPEMIPLIEAAFQRESSEWQASALIAMGRSNDERWEEQVISALLNDDPRVQIAAVKAAGNLELAEARPILLSALLEDEDNDELVAAGVWSLSQIGGEDARVYIESLIDNTEDEELITFLEEALDNLAFTEDLSRFDLLALDEDDIEMDEIEMEEDEEEN